jgi:hypothetical protein
MRRWAALALALLLVAAIYPDYPKPAEAQPDKVVLDRVQNAFESMGFLTKARNNFLSSVYEGIKLPTGYDILNFHGGEQAVREMLSEWLRATYTNERKIKEIVDAVIAGYATNKPVDRKMDLIIKVPGQKVEFLIEAKSADDFASNVVQTLHEALYDSYLSAKGDPVVWVTEGYPGQGWARRMLNYLSEKGVGISTSLSDQLLHAHALEKVAQRVYKISIKPILERVGKAHLLEFKDVLDFFKKKPQLVAIIVMVGADVATSLWQPRDENQALAKMAIQDVLRSGELAFTALTTAQGLAALALAIAMGSGVGIAVAAVALLPTIAVEAHAAVTGQRPSPHVKITKVNIDGVELTFSLIEPPEIWVPRKVVVSRGDEILVAVEVSRVTLMMGCQSKETWVGGGRLRVWCCASGCGAIITGYGTYNERQGRCTYSVSWSRTTSVSLSLGNLSLGRAPQPTTSYWSSRTLLYCEPEPQPQPRPVAAGGAPAQNPQQRHLLVEVRRWLSEMWERATWYADHLASQLAQIAAEPVLAVPIAVAVAAVILVAVKRRR